MESHGRLDKLSYRFFGLGPLADHWRSWIANTMGFRDMLPTDSFEPGHMFDFGTVRLQAIHTPGHTADHNVFLEPTDGVLLSGDIDLTSFGPWYGNLESDLPSFRRSIQLLRDVRPRMIAPGHGEPVFDQIDDAFGRYANVLDERNRKILALLQTPLSVSELVDAAPVYGHHPYEPELLRFFEHRMIEQHLEELEAGGLVRRSGPGLRYAAQ
jgi:glyoxylase-like metal-dependent hydrolase (beta-lactamase superfamily II)